jgi:hypothetical protein
MPLIELIEIGQRSDIEGEYNVNFRGIVFLSAALTYAPHL